MVRPVNTRHQNPKYFEAAVSELTGSFFFIFLFMLSTGKDTQFSEDKVINCFIIASAYAASRLMAGGELVTNVDPADADPIRVGPLLNPALALGQMLIATNFKFSWIYFLMPLGGCALALIFYDFVFVKS